MRSAETTCFFTEYFRCHDFSTLIKRLSFKLNQSISDFLSKMNYLRSNEFIPKFSRDPYT